MTVLLGCLVQEYVIGSVPDVATQSILIDCPNGRQTSSPTLTFIPTGGGASGLGLGILGGTPAGRKE